MLGETNLLGPQLVLMCAGAFLLIADLFIKRRDLLAGTAAAAVLGSVAYSAILLADGKVGREAFDGVLVFDHFALFFQFLLAGAALVTIAASWETLSRIPSRRGEYLALILFSVTGLMLLAGTRDLIGIFVALELTSLSQYVLVGFHKDRLGSEAGLKYLLLGAVASAVLLYGMAMLLGLTGSTNLSEIAAAIAGSGEGQLEALTFAAVFLIAGFGFKAAVAPFQMWVPDVYTGAPTAIAAFLSVASKAAAFAVLIRVFFEALGDDLLSADWSTIFAVLAALSMFVGNVLAIQQSNIKRMLAYSSVAQAGTVLIGLAAISAGRGELLGASGILFYLAGYTVSNLAAFLIVIVVHEKIGSFQIDDYRGLGRRAPLLAGVLALALISLTGLPPTAGFFGKLYLFDTAIQSGLAWLAVIGVVNTAISAAYYIRPIKAMFIDEPDLRPRPPGPALLAAQPAPRRHAGPHRRRRARHRPRPRPSIIERVTALSRRPSGCCCSEGRWEQPSSRVKLAGVLRDLRLVQGRPDAPSSIARRGAKDIGTIHTNRRDPALIRHRAKTPNSPPIADVHIDGVARRHTLDSTRRLRRPRAVSLRLADTRTVRRLNARYLGLDEPTDVLAFNTDIPGLRDPSGVAELGALIIAVPVAARGARARAVPLADELCLLAVHGALHLLGFDHETPSEDAAMRRMERRALVRLGRPGAARPLLDEPR